MHTAFLSLGSNVGDRLAQLREACERLQDAGEVVRISSYYETEPMEFTAQPWFLNCVVELRTESTPVELMRILLKIERAMGRERNQAKGPRNIDLDLLLYDDETVTTPELTLPHPAMHARRFVLVPLAEIAPGATHPILQKSARQLLASLPEGGEVHRWVAPED
jgi:2-amino-4-hydroxy-6-hydroxymethyldihydropteridine diphosphokinase